MWKWFLARCWSPLNQPCSLHFVCELWPKSGLCAGSSQTRASHFRELAFVGKRAQRSSPTCPRSHSMSSSESCACVQGILSWRPGNPVMIRRTQNPCEIHTESLREPKPCWNSPKTCFDQSFASLLPPAPLKAHDSHYIGYLI